MQAKQPCVPRLALGNIPQEFAFEKRTTAPGRMAPHTSAPYTPPMAAAAVSQPLSTTPRAHDIAGHRRAESASTSASRFHTNVFSRPHLAPKDKKLKIHQRMFQKEKEIAPLPLVSDNPNTPNFPNVFFRRNGKGEGYGNIPYNPFDPEADETEQPARIYKGMFRVGVPGSASMPSLNINPLFTPPSTTSQPTTPYMVAAPEPPPFPYVDLETTLSDAEVEADEKLNPEEREAALGLDLTSSPRDLTGTEGSISKTLSSLDRSTSLVGTMSSTEPSMEEPAMEADMSGRGEKKERERRTYNDPRDERVCAAASPSPSNDADSRPLSKRGGGVLVDVNGSAANDGAEEEEEAEEFENVVMVKPRKKKRENSVRSSKFPGKGKVRQEPSVVVLAPEPEPEEVPHDTYVPPAADDQDGDKSAARDGADAVEGNGERDDEEEDERDRNGEVDNVNSQLEALRADQRRSLTFVYNILERNDEDGNPRRSISTQSSSKRFGGERKGSEDDGDGPLSPSSSTPLDAMDKVARTTSVDSFASVRRNRSAFDFLRSGTGLSESSSSGAEPLSSDKKQKELQKMLEDHEKKQREERKAKRERRKAKEKAKRKAQSKGGLFSCLG